MKIGGLLERNGLTLYQIRSRRDQPGMAATILKFYARRQINIEYLTEAGSPQGDAVLHVCIDDDHFEEVQEFMRENPMAIKDLQIHYERHMSTIGIYGPHFREKPGIGARFCSLLGNAGINIHGISSSISSICCVIKTVHIEDARRAILSYFRLP
ncbi:MAG: hypothetical protein D6677_08725 [Calditrichaeota bacterium]|nr:MAG: hypothetical protein D6677_08725 [Calditrichota bacterium]